MLKDILIFLAGIVWIGFAILFSFGWIGIIVLAIAVSPGCLFLFICYPILYALTVEAGEIFKELTKGRK